MNKRELSEIDECDRLLDLAERRLLDGRINEASEFVRAARNGLSHYVPDRDRLRNFSTTVDPKEFP